MKLLLLGFILAEVTAGSIPPAIGRVARWPHSASQGIIRIEFRAIVQGHRACARSDNKIDEYLLFI